MKNTNVTLAWSDREHQMATGERHVLPDPNLYSADLTALLYGYSCRYVQQ